MVGTNANADVLSLTTQLMHTVECLNIFSKHPEWDCEPYRLTLWAIKDGNKDVVSKVNHISPSSWKGSINLENMLPIIAWNEGCEMVESEFQSLKIAELL